MKNKVTIIFSTLLFFSCSTSKKGSDSSVTLPSTEKKLTVLTKEYPGVFSIADSYIHLPLSEREKDPIVFSCSTGKAAETLKKLFTEMKDATKVSVNSYYIATCYYINKDFNRALHYYGKVFANALDVSLKSKALSNMATIQWELGKYRKAISYWRESYKLAQNPSVLYLLTLSELDLGLYQKTVDRKSEMARFNFTDQNWKALSAEVSFFTSDYEKAVLDYEGLSEDYWRKKNNSLVNYVVALFRTGRHEVAKNVVSKWKNILLTQSSYQAAKNLFPEIKKYE